MFGPIAYPDETSPSGWRMYPIWPSVLGMVLGVAIPTAVFWFSK